MKTEIRQQSTFARHHVNVRLPEKPVLTMANGDHVRVANVALTWTRHDGAETILKVVVAEVVTLPSGHEIQQPRVIPTPLLPVELETLAYEYVRPLYLTDQQP